jgi:hypothetical protein
MKWLTQWFDRKTQPRLASRVQPTLEALEDRQLLTVYYYGGALLPHVEVQALYLGRDWYSNSSFYRQTGQFEGFLNYIVQSPYMDMLTRAGYGVGRGSFTRGRIDLSTFDKRYYLTDGTIQNILQRDVNNGTLRAPDRNRLYVVFVEPGVAVQTSDGGDSINTFYGYHSASHGYAYAVIPYEAGINAAHPGLSAFDGMTETVSHELAEAVTDPMTDGRIGWYDYSYNGEIGDIVNGQAVRLHGYVVQKEAGRNDQPLTPAGATPLYSSIHGAVSSPLSAGLQPATGSRSTDGPTSQDFAVTGLHTKTDLGGMNGGPEHHALADALFSGGVLSGDALGN